MHFFCLSFSKKAICSESDWTEVAPGVWKAVAGTPDKLDLFNAAGISPAVRGIENDEPCRFSVFNRMKLLLKLLTTKHISDFRL